MVKARGSTFTAGTVSIPGVNESLRPAIEMYDEEGGDGQDIEASLDLAGRWNDLDLRGLLWSASSSAIEHPRVSLIFSSSFEDVVTRLKNLGFPVSLEAGQYDTPDHRSFSGDVGTTYVEAMVQDLGKEHGVYFSCFQMAY
jgi:hypothetical protein